MPVISVKNLTKKFGSFTAVDDLSFEVNEHHVVGFLGPNGAGKTTALRMMVGLSKPKSGSIEIAGKKVTFGGTSTNRDVGYLPELPSMYSWMSGQEYLNFIAKIFGMKPNTRRAKIRELLKLTGLTEASNRRIGAYSGGMKQRLGIAQALLNDPKVLILDEPVSALDPIGRKDVLNVIEKLKTNRTVFFSTHILSDVDRICDDVVIINKGKLVAAAPLAGLKAKYATPILEIEFNHDAKTIALIMKQQKWARKVVQNGNKVKIWLTDPSVVEQNLPLRLIAGAKIGVLKYGLTLPETEDLFINLLGENK